MVPKLCQGSWWVRGWGSSENSKGHEEIFNTLERNSGIFKVCQIPWIISVSDHATVLSMMPHTGRPLYTNLQGVSFQRRERVFVSPLT